MCIRWVDEVNEKSIAFVQVPKTDSQTLYTALHDVCICCMLPLKKCRGQAYDGASYNVRPSSWSSCMSQARASAALHVHCLTHSLNICLQDTSRICSCIRETLHLVMELVQLIKWSPKRNSLFEQLKEEMSPETHTLRPLCPTRWTVRTRAIHAVVSIYMYETLCKVLDEVG